MTNKADMYKGAAEKSLAEKVNGLIYPALNNQRADVFDNEEKRRCASTILSYLRNRSDVNVKTITEDIGVSETMAQKIVHKLSLYKYISTKRGHEGKALLVSLQL